MIFNLGLSFSKNYGFFRRFLFNNSCYIYTLRDSLSFNKYGSITNSYLLVPSYRIHQNKTNFSAVSSHFNDKKVDFTHLPLHSRFVNNLKCLGIKDLNLFQYVIYKVLTDNLIGNSENKANDKFLRLVFYNEAGSGQSIGALLSLLCVYSRKYRNPSSSYSTGSLLIICSGNHCDKISNLLLGIDPSLKCLVLDDSSAHLRNPNQIGHDFSSNSKDYLNRFLKQNELSRRGSYDVIVASHNVLLKQTKRNSLTLLSRVSCILFDDLSSLKDYNLFNENLKVIRESKRINVNDSECSYDFHVICLTSSLCDRFAEFSRSNLSNYTLYDFKFGTKQKLISDSRTDVLKVDVDFGQTRVINLDSEEQVESKNVEHSICKVSKSEKYDRVEVLKNLVYSYLDLPGFMDLHSLPLCLKRPTAKSKCIIFVSNRKQILKLANMAGFSNLSVYLGRHLNVYERARAISSFNAGSKPIMIATDNSICGLNFDNVSHIFNFNPPKTVESYKSRVGFARKHNSLCLTLYSKDQYPGLVSIVKQVVKKISVHIVPSKEYMAKHDLKWLKTFINQLIDENKNVLAPYLKKSEELLLSFGDSTISKCASILLRDKLLAEDSIDEGLISSSILTGKSGFTAVVITDVSKQYINDESDVRNLFSKYVPDCRLTSAIGKCYRTETGCVVDVANRYIRNFVELSRDNQDISVQIATEVPKILLSNTHIGKLHKRGLPLGSLEVKRPPVIGLKGF